MPLLEVCVDSLDGLRAAEDGGASRIELCSRLDLGGLSPSPELLAAALAATRLPIHVMVRPRPGGFVYAEPEVLAMEREIERLRETAAAGVVFGCLRVQGAIDVLAASRLLAAARPKSATFHKAFDQVPDPAAALEDLVRLGVDRVLTSGGAADAFLGRAAIRSLVEQARGRIVVLAGGGVRPANAAAILSETGVVEIHGSVPFEIQDGGAQLPGRPG